MPWSKSKIRQIKVLHRYQDQQVPVPSCLHIRHIEKLNKQIRKERWEKYMDGQFKQLEEKIGYHFSDEALFKTAVTHSSYANEKQMKKWECNERLEFLGDAVLELISSEHLFFEDLQMSEGELTKTRASMVCEPTLAYCAREMELGKYLLMGKGEEGTGGRKRDSILADAMEALIGAIYLDGGFASAKEFIFKFILDDVEHKKLFCDSKTILQEIVQANFSKEISYRLEKEEGPDHDKFFYVALYIGDELYGKGSGRTKKAAEQQAAYRAVVALEQVLEKRTAKN